MNKDINRIKTVLCEKKRTNKWLAEQLNVNPTTVSKSCANTSQPDLHTLSTIATLLDIDIRLLLNSTESFGMASEPVIIYGIKTD